MLIRTQKSKNLKTTMVMMGISTVIVASNDRQQVV